MRTFLLPLALTLTFTACKGDDKRGDPPSDIPSHLQRFASCEDFSDALVESFTEQLVYSRYGYWAYAEDAGSDGGDNSDGGGGPSDYSTTNVQVEGVDEPDIVKTDGNFLYVVNTQRPALSIVDSWPPEEANLASQVELEGYPYDAFLYGDTVAVFQYVWNYSGYDRPEGGYSGTDSPVRNGYGTRVTLVDVSDRAAPEIVREIDIEGYMADARLIDGDAWLVMNTWFSMPQEIWEIAWRDDLALPEYDYSADEATQEAQRAVARAILQPLVQAAVDDMDVTELLPYYYESIGADAGAWSDGDVVAGCSDIYHPDGVAQPGMMALVHLDLGAPEAPWQGATGLFANGWTVYATAESMYVAQASYWWSWGWDDSSLETHIHRFSLDAGDAVYEASGSVEGWLLNQFSMDEYGGFLRVATTEWDWWWGTSDGTDVNGNGVYVMAESGGELSTVGSVTDLAPGEMIYSARFDGDQGWLVTFRQTDPLFALDLSVPTNPVVVGELEIPGFSSYMHPVDGGYLLTVGMAGEDDGTLTGFAVKLFDVRDPTNPVQVQEMVASSDDWSYSEAMWDHHAFTFHNGVLAVPLYTYEYDEGTGSYDTFSGLWVIGVDPGGTNLTELGRVDHDDLVAASECVYTWYYGDDAGVPCEDYYWYAGMRRSVIMEDKLYSVSDYGVKVSELLTPDDTVASVLFWPL